MRKILAAAGVKTQSEQQSQHEQLMADIALVLEKHNTSLADLGRQSAEFAANFKEIAKLKETVERQQALTHEQLRAIGDGVGYGANYRGLFGTRQNASNFGRILIALKRQAQGDPSGIAELQKAAILPSTGESGGALIRSAIMEGILRYVEQFGVAMRLARRLPMSSPRMSVAKRTEGVEVFHPDLGVSPTESSPKFGAIVLELVDYVTLTDVDNNMLQDDLAVGLAEFIGLEIAWRLGYRTDLYVFMGDGTPANAKVRGLFRLPIDTSTNIKEVVADTGDNSFGKIAGKSSVYLAKAMGELPQWVEQFNPAWLMHRSVYAEYIGARDTAGRPIWNVIMEQGKPVPVLLGYPVEVIQVGPRMADSAVSTVMFALAAVQAAVFIGQHSAGMEIAISEHSKFAEGQTRFRGKLRQAIALAEGSAVVRVKTAAS
ncbi:MAG: phage major capsid protein [Phycisphaerae bacterium]|nr:phage major capsid protein [Phycisphaerae bacterium]